MFTVTKITNDGFLKGRPVNETTRRGGRFSKALLATALLLTSMSLMAARPAEAAEEFCLSQSPDIYDLQVANFYNDGAPASFTNKNWARIVVVPGGPLPIIPGAFCQSSVQSVSVTGPAGFNKPIGNVPFSTGNLSGYLKDPGTGAIAYTKIQGKGFLPNGQYTATVKYKNGVSKSKTRTLNFDANDQKILDKYLAQRDAFAAGRKPAQAAKIPAGTSPTGVKLQWTKLNMASGPFDFFPTTVFYSGRVSTGTGGDPGKGFWSSSCILGDLLCSFNGSEFAIDKPLTPGASYSWSLDLSDSSAMATQDLVIGTKTFYFKYPGN